MWTYLGTAILLTLTGLRVQTVDPSTVVTGDEKVGRWVPFYHLEFGADRLEYYYDGDSLVSRGGHAVARWKVVGRNPATITLTVTEIDCDARTFTERATTLIDAGGNSQVVPSNELFAARPIEAGKSADIFARIACRPRERATHVNPKRTPEAD